jgi:Leucine-rich repeat (LRR) protein
MSSTETKIRALLFSPSKENQHLGWLLDKIQNAGKIKRMLEAEQAGLLRQRAGWTIEKLLLAKRVICNDKNASQIHIKNLPTVNSLSCQKHPQLLSFRISNCPNLEHLYCSNDNALESISIENCPNLTYISCINNQLSNLKIEAPELTHLYAASNQLKHFDISVFSKLVGLDIAENPIKTLKVSADQKQNFRVNLSSFTKVIT